MKLRCMVLGCLVLLVSCGTKRGFVPPLAPPDAFWCDKFEREIIPKREEPYLIEGVWLNESFEGPELRFFPDGRTEDAEVRWRIENAKVLHLTGEEPRLFFTYRREGASCIVKTLSVDQFTMTMADLNSEVTLIKKTPENPAWALRPLTPEEIEDVMRRVSALVTPLTESDFLDAVPELDFNGKTEAFKTESFEDGDAERLVWKKWQERFEVRLRVQGKEGERRILEVAVLGPFDEAHPPPDASNPFADCPITSPDAEYIAVRAIDDGHVEVRFQRDEPSEPEVAEIGDDLSGIDIDHKKDLHLLFGGERDGLFLPNCRGPGACLQGVYLGCGGNRYAAALPKGEYGRLGIGAPYRFQDGVRNEMVEERPRLVEGHYETETFTRRFDGTAFLVVKTEVYPEENTSAPIVFDAEGGDVTVSRLPAVSADGKRVAAVNQWEGYDGSSRRVLEIYRTEDGAPVRDIVLVDRENGEDLPRKTVAQTRRAVAEANALLSRGGFVPMLPLGGNHSPNLIQKAYGGGVHVIQKEGGAKVFVVGDSMREIVLEGFASSGFCCHGGDGPENTSCELQGFLSGAWVHETRGALLLRYENFMGPDGCETEERYIATTVK